MRTHAASVLLLLVAVACGSVRERNGVPEPLAHEAQVPGMPGVRILVTSGRLKMGDIDEFVGRGPALAASGRPLTMLALSGGSDDGAFGAGLLCGWSAAGDRPAFDIVTGISTGGLTAPFAFLGPDCDGKLRESFTSITAKDIYEKRSIFTILGQRDAIADSAPLARLIERTFGAGELAAVAKEYAKGRKLYIGTTHMDADCGAVWDMGAIASSGHPGALALFRKIMLASASIPIAFPPVYFDVEAGGKRYEELHADGGMVAQVFGAAYFDALLRRQGKDATGAFYLVRNSRILPRYSVVTPKMSSLGGRAIGSLIRMQGIGDILRNYQFAMEAHVAFHLAYIPEEFEVRSKESFDKTYMNALFDWAFARAKAGYPWLKEPVGMGAATQPD